MKKSLFLCLIACFLLIMSCGKENHISTSIVAKWDLVKSVSTNTLTQQQTTETFDAGSYANFNTNGICYSFVDSINNLSNWHYLSDDSGVYIQPNNGFVANDSGYTIQNISSQSLILFSRKIELGQSQTLYFQK